MTNEKHFSKHFNPDIAFFDLPLIRRTLRGGYLIVIGLVVIISAVDWRDADWSADGFNELITMFKLPIGVLAFFAALLALFATNHRSEQNKNAMALTQRSINATGDQNRFANYYKHLEEFQKYADSIKNSDFSDALYFDKLNKRKLHNALFPNAKLGVFELRKPILDSYCEYWINLAELISRSVSEKTLKGFVTDEVMVWRTHLVLMLDQGGILKHVPKAKVEGIEYNEDLRRAPTVREFLCGYREELEFFYQVLSFDTSFDENRVIRNSSDTIYKAWKYFETNDEGFIYALVQPNQLIEIAAEMKRIISGLKAQMDRGTAD